MLKKRNKLHPSAENRVCVSVFHLSFEIGTHKSALIAVWKGPDQSYVMVSSLYHKETRGSESTVKTIAIAYIEFQRHHGDQAEGHNCPTKSSVSFGISEEICFWNPTHQPFLSLFNTFSGSLLRCRHKQIQSVFFFERFAFFSIGSFFHKTEYSRILTLVFCQSFLQSTRTNAF